MRRQQQTLPGQVDRFYFWELKPTSSKISYRPFHVDMFQTLPNMCQTGPRQGISPQPTPALQPGPCASEVRNVPDTGLQCRLLWSRHVKSHIPHWCATSACYWPDCARGRKGRLLWVTAWALQAFAMLLLNPAPPTIAGLTVSQACASARTNGIPSYWKKPEKHVETQRDRGTVEFTE